MQPETLRFVPHDMGGHVLDCSPGMAGGMVHPVGNAAIADCENGMQLGHCFSSTSSIIHRDELCAGQRTILTWRSIYARIRGIHKILAENYSHHV